MYNNDKSHAEAVGKKEFKSTESNRLNDILGEASTGVISGTSEALVDSSWLIS